MRYKFQLLAFLEGFFFLSFELIGVQLLQPTYGASYFVWMYTICIVMGTSALGYFLGAWLVTKNNQEQKSCTIAFLMVISIYLIAYYSINEMLFLRVRSLDTIPALLLHAFFLIGIPVLLITSFSPLLIKELSNQKQWQGKSASSIFTFSTLGGIVSIYLLAFFLLPSKELITIIYLFGAGITVLALLVLFKLGKKTFVLIHIGLVGLTLAIVSDMQKQKMVGKNTEVVYRTHGILGELEIRDEYSKYRYLDVNRMIQSGIQLEKDLSALTYPFRISSYASGYPARSKVLVGGLGGGVLINQLQALNFDIDVVDFDERLLDLSLEYMRLKPDFKFIVDDFRHYIQSTDQKYDVVIVDLSKAESIPTNVYTVEGFKQINSILKPNGTIFINYFSRTNGLGDKGMHSVMKTLQRAGYFVGLIRKMSDDNTNEEIIIASNSPQLAQSYALRMPANTLKNLNFVVNNYVRTDVDYSKAAVLYDDKSALEKQQFEVILDLREKSRNNEYSTFFEKE